MLKNKLLILSILGIVFNFAIANETKSEVESNNGIYVSGGVASYMLKDVSIYTTPTDDTTTSNNLALGYQFVNVLKPSLFEKTSLDIELGGSQADSIGVNVGLPTNTALVGSIVDDYELSSYSFLVRYNAHFNEKFFIGANLGMSKTTLEISAEDYNLNVFDFEVDYHDKADDQGLLYGIRVGYEINKNHLLSVDYNISNSLNFTISDPKIVSILNSNEVTIDSSSALALNYRYTFR